MSQNEVVDDVRHTELRRIVDGTSMEFWKKFAGITQPHFKNEPEILWHYTDLNGLVSIIDNGVLWSSSAFHTNDKEEIYHASNKFWEYFKKNKYIEAENRRLTISLLFDALKINYEQVAPEAVFISCFCENPDLLSQWTNYAGANGVAIGFQKAELFNASRTPFYNTRQSMLSKVCYKSDDLDKTIAAATELFINNFEKFLGDDPYNKNGQIASVQYITYFGIAFRNCIDLISPIFKNDAFESESEWRIMTHHPADSEICKFRSRSGLLLPYIEYGKHCWKKLPIVEIKVGPSPEKDLNRGTVAAFLRSRGYGQVAVSKSSVPFRG